MSAQAAVTRRRYPRVQPRASLGFLRDRQCSKEHSFGLALVPQALQKLSDELAASRASRRSARTILRELRAIPPGPAEGSSQVFGGFSGVIFVGISELRQKRAQNLSNFRSKIVCRFFARLNLHPAGLEPAIL